MADTGAPDHETRVKDAFDSLHAKVGTRLDDDSRRHFDSIRSAATSRDSGKLRENLSAVQEKHGWLYRELAEHPAIATLLDELALSGF